MSDTSHLLDEWLRTCQQLAQRHQLTDIHESLERLHARKNMPASQLAFVGEFNRGKSTLINRLLNEEVVPVGAIITTATLITIRAGQGDVMQIRYPDGAQDTRVVSPSAWEPFLEGNMTDTAHDLIRIDIELPHPWLLENDMAIVDTPGAGDLNQDRTRILFDLFSYYDAAVLLVSATSPFSMTEAAFLEQEVVGRHIPAVMVVVSYLDLLRPEERDMVLRSVRQRVAEIAPDIPVLPGFPLDDDTSPRVALEAIRSQINQLIDRAERRHRRSRQIAHILIDTCDRMIDLSDDMRAASQLDDAERQRHAAEIKAQIEDDRLVWNDIRLNFRRRAVLLGTELRRDIMGVEDELLKRLLNGMRRARDVKDWWQHHLPYQIRHELVALSQRFERKLVDSLAVDFAWVRQQVLDRFGLDFDREASPEHQDRVSISPDLKVLDFRNKETELLRLGTSTAALISILLTGPAARALSTGTMLVGEQLLRAKTEKDRARLVEQELRRTVTETLSNYAEKVLQRRQELYDGLLDDLQQTEVIWRATFSEAAEQPTSAADDQRWVALRTDAEQLKTTIQTHLYTL